MTGQVLCLEAAAQGVRGTGIGCFFNDPVPELMSLPDDAGLYHFTAGGPREDARLATRAAYHHLEASVRFEALARPGLSENLRRPECTPPEAEEPPDD